VALQSDLELPLGVLARDDCERLRGTPAGCGERSTTDDARGNTTSRGGKSKTVNGHYRSTDRRGRYAAGASRLHGRGKRFLYGAPFHGRRASNGEIYDMNKMTAAHRTMRLERWCA